jgi:hypothetical protein
MSTGVHLRAPKVRGDTSPGQRPGFWNDKAQSGLKARSSLLSILNRPFGTFARSSAKSRARTLRYSTSGLGWDSCLHDCGERFRVETGSSYERAVDFGVLRLHTAAVGMRMLSAIAFPTRRATSLRMTRWDSAVMAGVAVFPMPIAHVHGRSPKSTEGAGDISPGQRPGFWNEKHSQG